MRLLQLARKELGDEYRSRTLHLLLVFFALIGGLIGYVANDDPTTGLLVLLTFLAPLVGLVYTQHTIVGKRTSGELSVLLGLPFSRREVVAGTYLGRTALLWTALGTLFVAATVTGLLSGTPLDPGHLLAAFVISAVIGAIFVSIAVGISATVRSSDAASVLAFGAYLLFAFQLWSIIPDAIRYLVNGFTQPSGRPTWAELFDQLSPFAAVRNAATPIVPELVDSLPTVGASVADQPPVYQQAWFAGLVVVVWLVVPAAIGYLNFERTDL